MKLNKFKFHFAKRNILANKKNSLVVILTLSLIFCLLLLLVGLNSTSLKIYELNQIYKYDDIDIVISYDEYSSSRLINRRNVVDEYDEYINYALSFFNLDVLVEVGETQYFKMMSSLSHEFELLVDDDVLILDYQVIITESLSEKYNLEIGDTFTFTILDNQFDYVVGDIFEDTGQFSGDAFYLDKEELMSVVYGFNLTNFGNVLYIDLLNESNVTELYNLLLNDSDYDNYSLIETLDWDYIENRANDLSSMFIAIGLIVILAVFLVLDSLFPIISKDIPKQLGIVKTLGGEDKFVWGVYLAQWLLYSFISVIIGTVLSLVVVNLGLSAVGISGFIPINILAWLITISIISIYILIRSKISFDKESIKSSVTLSRSNRYLVYKSNILGIIIPLFILSLELIFNVLPLKYHALVVVVTSIYLTFNLMSYILILLSKVINKRKKSLFSIFQVKYLQDNKNLHHSLRVLTISLIALIMILSFRVFMDNQVSNFENIMTYDLAITNIYDLDQDLVDEVNLYDVEDVTQSSIYQHASILIGDKTPEACRYLVSLDYQELDKYFGFDVLEYDDRYSDNEEVYVLLPKSYKLVYNLEIGDTLRMDINYLMKDVDVYVGGFIDIDYDNFAYINITEVEEYKTLAKQNTILVNTDDIDSVYSELINNFSSRMYYIINPDFYFDGMITEALTVVDFFAVFTLFIVLCFVIIIFNNTVLIFNSLKSDLAKIKSLGADRNIFRKAILKEYITIGLLIVGLGTIESIVLSDNVRYLVLFTNYYKDITANVMTITYGCVLVLIVLLISYLFYLYNISKIKVIEEIKF